MKDEDGIFAILGCAKEDVQSCWIAPPRCSRQDLC